MRRRKQDSLHARGDQQGRDACAAPKSNLLVRGGMRLRALLSLALL
jgi:hypothetical protein